MTVAKEPRTLSGNFEIAISLTDRRTLKVTGCLYSDDRLPDMHSRIDMVQEVLDRQAIRSDMQNKEAQIAQHLQNLENIHESYAGLIEIQKSAKKLTSQQQQSIAQFEPTVRQATKMIENLRAAIREGRQKLNGQDHVG